ncbi:LysR family transcriptional regulator [Kushneria phosphatilytica]|uniref:LysR family transcriptional regulator n=1 Tax=Kushneria phosphatilytica TaxID=657387 RepID=A0A1S1NYK0_9GAMM|nr:LysR family transcriptional regulator [Kushneria phosphatilytica]OHV12751.1 LysR family transcriptional regulator [Kushneria phosphatilytica]QEL10592.1 LysR family transcriptional regulator [Kushneria phosphatilytica]
MQRWDRIEAFIEVARVGSFSRAARHLKVSPSHVSRLISQLEQQLGVPLLYRTTRRLHLTDAGLLYFDRCLPMLSGLAEAEQAVRTLRDEPSGTLRVVAPPVFGERYIAPLINEFANAHTTLDVQMTFTDESFDLIGEGFDLGVRIGVLEDSTLIARRLCERPLHVVATPDYLKRHGRPATLSDLTRHNCLTGADDHWLFEVHGQRREPRVTGNWQANSSRAMLDAVTRGMGLAQLPEDLIDEHLQTGWLERVLEAFRYPHTGAWIVYPRHRQPSSRVRQFVDFLVERMSTPGTPSLSSH